jgi:hypothetical protein
MISKQGFQAVEKIVLIYGHRTGTYFHQLVKRKVVDFPLVAVPRAGSDPAIIMEDKGLAAGRSDTGKF